MKEPLVVLAGPTAVGKTRLSIALAKALDAEIISADSMQVYRHMDIGSAKITKEEMEGIPHHLVDVLEPEEEFHIVRFAQMAREAMTQIRSRGKIPLLVGGTGFYIQAVTRNIDFTPADADPDFRRELENLAREKGPAYLHQMLSRVDPESAEQIHENNVKRVIRALEFYHQNKTPISQHNKEQRAVETPYNLVYFVLTAPRDLLYQRIDKRVDQMMEAGLLEEVRSLWDRGCRPGMVSMQGLGYRELLSYLEGEISLPEAVELIKKNTRHYAKRQLTWFRREPDAVWVNQQDFSFDEEKILEYMLSLCRERLTVS